MDGLSNPKEWKNFLDRVSQAKAEFDKACESFEDVVPQSNHKTTSKNPHIWTSPPNGILKINCDATLISKKNQTSIGVVIRNYNGEVLAVSCAPETSVETRP